MLKFRTKRALFTGTDPRTLLTSQDIVLQPSGVNASSRLSMYKELSGRVAVGSIVVVDSAASFHLVQTTTLIAFHSSSSHFSGTKLKPQSSSPIFTQQSSTDQFALTDLIEILEDSDFVLVENDGIKLNKTTCDRLKSYLRQLSKSKTKSFIKEAEGKAAPVSTTSRTNGPTTRATTRRRAATEEGNFLEN